MSERERDVDDLEGRALDGAVAEEVMGFEVVMHPHPDQPFPYSEALGHAIPCYSRDMPRRPQGRPSAGRPR